MTIFIAKCLRPKYLPEKHQSLIRQSSRSEVIGRGFGLRARTTHLRTNLKSESVEDLLFALDKDLVCSDHVAAC
jgi:hypothetical protein